MLAVDLAGPVGQGRRELRLAGAGDPTGVLEPAARTAVFAGLLAILAVWELLAPRRHRELGRRVRWPGNLGVVILDTLLVRTVLVPALAIFIGQRRFTERRGGSFVTITGKAGAATRVKSLSPLAVAALGVACGTVLLLVLFCTAQLFNPYLLRVEDKEWLDRLAASKQ